MASSRNFRRIYPVLLFHGIVMFKKSSALFYGHGVDLRMGQSLVINGKKNQKSKVCTSFAIQFRRDFEVA